MEKNYIVTFRKEYFVEVRASSKREAMRKAGEGDGDMIQGPIEGAQIIGAEVEK